MLVIILLLCLYEVRAVHGSEKLEKEKELTMEENSGLAYATFGMGCFWCGEAVFQKLDGVKSVTTGYEGGYIENPSYEQVCSGKSGHAEVIRIEYDPTKVDYNALLNLFWIAHDPTQLNGQGNDIGTQYRSVIFCHSDKQQEAAELSKKNLSTNYTNSNPIVTEISSNKTFYSAEDYHQNYFKNNPNHSYCRFVIIPKLKQLGIDINH